MRMSGKAGSGGWSDGIVRMLMALRRSNLYPGERDVSAVAHHRAEKRAALIRSPSSTVVAPHGRESLKTLI
jgi:hypothetical protein